MAARVKLTWAATALDDLDDIAAFIALENPRAAATLVAKVVATVERLRTHPASGRWVPEAPRKTYREIVVPPCRIVYRREGTGVLIVYVARGERMLRSHGLV